MGGNTVTGNTITGNTESGIELMESPDNTITENTITVNNWDLDYYKHPSETEGLGAGILIRSDDVASSGNHINYNNIYDNTEYGVYTYHTTDTTVIPIIDATLNWWGHSSGPGGPYGRINKAENIIGKGDSVSDNVDWDPWLPQPVFHTPHDPLPPGLYE